MRWEGAGLEREVRQLRSADAKGCLQAIAKSGLGKTVQKLSKHHDAQVAEAASELCAYWRTLIRR